MADYKTLFDKAILINQYYTIDTCTDKKCYAIDIVINDYETLLVYIPDDVTELNSDKMEFTHSIGEYTVYNADQPIKNIKIVGGNNLRNANDMISHIVVKHVDLSELNTLKLEEAESAFAFLACEELVLGAFQTPNLYNILNMFYCNGIEKLTTSNRVIKNIFKCEFRDFPGSVAYMDEVARQIISRIYPDNKECKADMLIQTSNMFSALSEEDIIDYGSIYACYRPSFKFNNKDVYIFVDINIDDAKDDEFEITAHLVDTQTLDKVPGSPELYTSLDRSDIIYRVKDFVDTIKRKTSLGVTHV